MLRKALSGKRAAALRKNPLRGGGGPAQLRRIGAQGVKSLCAVATTHRAGRRHHEPRGKLRADEYGGDEDFSWVLLEPAEGA